MKDLHMMHPSKFRQMVRRGEWTGTTVGLAQGYAQANLVIVPKDLAVDFFTFAQRNPQPCPILDVTEPGKAEPLLMAPGADLRTDLPKYRVYREGELIGEFTDINEFWRDDLVCFLLGCSLSVDQALLEAGIPVRHLEEGENGALFITNIPCRPAGRISGSLVVSMRPIPGDKVTRAVQITSHFPLFHGAPVYAGAPSGIGIADAGKPDFGDRLTIREGETPVFWACGVTPQVAAMRSKVDLMITQAPSHMFVTDIKYERLAAY